MTYVGGLVRERTGGDLVVDGVGRRQDVLTGVVDTLDEGGLLAEDRRIGVWWRVRAGRRQVLLLGLLERIVTGVVAELIGVNNEQCAALHWMHGTYAGGLVHVNPSAVDVETGLRAEENLKLVVPVADEGSVN